MAILHHATLVPGKIELIEAWLPSQPWFPGGPASGLERVAAYRFDDPDGEVGIETLLVRAPSGLLLHVPLTYRGAPLDGGEAWLVGTMQHSVLGPRWVYDATGDPVWVTEVARVIREGDTEVAQFYDTPDGPEPVDSPTHVRGSGVTSAASRPEVVRVVGGDAAPVALPLGAPTLTGTWPGQAEPTVLVYLV